MRRGGAPGRAGTGGVPVGSKPYAVPYRGQGSVFDEEDISAVDSLLRSGVHLSDGHEANAFEREFARAVGARHALALTNCTVALELATHLAGLEPGDEVIATPMTYQSTVLPLLARPVDVSFCDVDSNSLSLDPERLAEMIGARTRAIYVTHYGGLMAEMDAIMELAREKGIFVIEDCAHALGSVYRGNRRAGTLGDAGCWSFQSLKNISTLGQGGMITVGDARHAEVVARLRAMEPDADFVELPEGRRFGQYGSEARTPVARHDKNAYTHDCVGIRSGGTNAIMSDVAAAVGRTQLGKLEVFVERRRAIARRLDEALSEIPGVRVQVEPPGSRHAYHLYSFFVSPSEGLDRDNVVERLHECDVEIVLRYFPLHLLPEWRYRGGRFGACPTAERIWFEELVNLPIYPTLSDAQVDHMISAVRWAVGASGKPRVLDA